MDAMSRADAVIQVHKFLLIPRSQNAEANDLAQKASGYKAITGNADFPVQCLELRDWRADIFNYVKDPARGAPKRT
jgi:hypothetical protein